MAGTWRWLSRFRRSQYSRPARLVAVNGLAEQAESWYRNLPFWRRYFDVLSPNILDYDGDELHRRIDAGQPITVDYLVEQLRLFLVQFVQSPPYHLVASSLGAKIAVEFAARHPELVDRMVLLCPSGFGDAERLPLIDGVRRGDPHSVVASVFHDLSHVEPEMVRYYQRQFNTKRWRTGIMRTIRGTLEHCVRDRLPEVTAPTLVVAGAEDRIVDPHHAKEAACDLPHGQFVMVRDCGHAPQIEKAWYINRLVTHFLIDSRPSPTPRWSQLAVL